MEKRIKFDKLTLQNIFDELSLSSKEISIRTGISYNTIKQWKRGSLLMPLFFFDELCTFNSNIEKYRSQGKLFDSNWPNKSR